MSSGGNSREAYFKRVVESIGVAVGAHLVPQAEIEVSGNERSQIVRSLNKGASEGHRLLPPIPVQHPHHFAGFQDFVRAYVNRFSEPFSQLAGFWYRILTGFDNGLENQALVLTTAIEGVLKAYFQSEGQPDEEFLRQVTDAIPKIKELNNLEPRARERILSTLGNAKNPTPSNALKSLYDLGVIPHPLVTVWKGLRNKAAHADELNFDSENIQVFVDQLYACLELFYRLVFWLVGYSGSIVEYSRCGWPEVKLEASS
ncbi:hypothetical protein [Pseudomonas aeruginosa]|uniref:hypothetical protein n=1 Tax=Pseudomonas aeruginosa TaxID=287 RepID=UPI0032E3791F